MATQIASKAIAQIQAQGVTGRTRQDSIIKPATVTDPNGLTVGNYTFIKTLGEGNFAKVKLAKHRLTGMEVAIKIIDKSKLDEKKLSKLYREVRIMKMLNHPHIVKLFEVIETKSTLYLVMEAASGGELYDYLVVHGRMKEKEARAKFRQILSAVSYCHKKRVIHRDLKAENLLLDGNLDMKIADFGFSNTFDPESKLDTFCGSPPYAAPELFQGRKYVGPEVDIWSLGVILYVLTTGCLPFDGKNLQEMRESVCRGKYRIPFYLSDSCEKLLRKFLIRDPVKRSSLEMLTDDPWINESYSDSPITSDLSTKIEEDESTIQYMSIKYSLDRDQIVNSIRENVYDDIAAIYYLLHAEKDTKKQLPSPPVKSSSSSDGSSTDASSSSNNNNNNNNNNTNRPNKEKPQNNMQVIGEDDVLVTAGTETKTETDAAKAAARRRRFTVSGEGSNEEKDNSPTSSTTQTQSIKKNTTTTATNNNQHEENFQNAEENPSKNSDDEETENNAEKPTRKRHNTIVGILRQPLAGRKDDGPVSAGVENDDIIEESKEDGAPRSLRFTFNSSSTSSKAPDDIVQEVINACIKQNIKYKSQDRFLLECIYTPNPEVEPVKFEIEVCKLPRLKNLHGLRFKRLSGSSSDYKEVCENILSAVQL